MSDFKGEVTRLIESIPVMTERIAKVFVAVAERVRRFDIDFSFSILFAWAESSVETRDPWESLPDVISDFSKAERCVIEDSVKRIMKIDA